MKKTNKKQKTLDTLYTHTDSLLKQRKTTIAVIIVIICISIIILANKNGILKKQMLLSNSRKNKIGESIDTSNWDKEKVNIIYDTEGTPVPVPKGFTASNADGEHTINTGFVIYEGNEEVNNYNAWDESCARNQFVWVPVYDTSRIYEEIGTTGKKKSKLWEFNENGRTEIFNSNTDDRREPGIITNHNGDKKQYFSRNGMQGYTREKLFKELEISFNKDIESIKKYGGFYIGRYETGNITSEQPVVQRMNTTISNQTWYAMYPRMKNICKNENSYTEMIWGCIFDETLQWLIESGNKTQNEVAIDSINWGNYYRSSFEYISETGTKVSKSNTSAVKIPTGSSEKNKANNIYDLAGNVSEWTLEQNASFSYYMRGRNYGVSSNIHNVSDRVAFGDSLVKNIEYGFRSCLYIK